MAALSRPAEAPAAAIDERLAGLRLSKPETVSVHRVEYRGRPWYLLQDALGRRQVRISETAHALVSALDGRRTLAQVCERQACDPQLNAVLLNLIDAGLLVTERPSVDALLARQALQRRQRRMMRWMRLLSPRIPLIEPDAFVQRVLPWVGWLFHPWSLVTALCLIALAALQATMQLEVLTRYGAQRLDDPHSWLWLAAIYPAVKLLHELGHGIAARRCGSPVGEMGITLLVFLPVPYVDASAATVLPDKRQRMLIAAAGILVELALAASAMFVWMSVDDGGLRDAAFAVMLIGGVSTLLFNGNPLLRFDGYYVLADALEIPNLATRAARYYGYLLRRFMLGLGDEASPLTAPGERRWLLLYGLLSPLYRWAIAIGIALFLIDTVPSLGVLLASWLLAAQLLLPLARQIRFLLFDPRLAGRRGRAMALTVLLIGLPGAALVAVPVPSSTAADGIVMLPERSAVRAGSAGFVVRRMVDEGAAVQPGELLFELDDPQLRSAHDALRARVAELMARRDQVPFDRRMEREVAQARLDGAREQLATLAERLTRLAVTSPGRGRVHIVGGDDRLGRFVERGDLLATLSSPADARVRVVAGERDAARIRRETHAVRVRLADGAAGELKGRLLTQVPAASNQLPSPALGSRGGGALQVDARDDQGITTLQRFFAFDIAIPPAAPTRFVGSRAFVRFEHEAEPLLARGYDAARQLLIERIGE